MSDIRPGDEQEPPVEPARPVAKDAPEWTKWIGMIVGALVPLILSLAAYVEASAAAKKAQVAVVSTSKESATSDLSYAQVIEELNALKAQQRKRDLEIALLNERNAEHHPADRALSSTTAPTVDEAKAALKFPPLPLPSERPAPTAARVIEAIKQAQAAPTEAL